MIRQGVGELDTRGPARPQRRRASPNPENPKTALAVLSPPPPQKKNIYIYP